MKLYMKMETAIVAAIDRSLIKGVDQASVLLFCSIMILSENRHPSIGSWPEDMLFGTML